MVYWTRKRAGLSDLSVWGIATDSNYWNFIHIRPDGTVQTNISLVWEMLTNILSLVCDGDIHLPQHPAKDHVHDFQALSPCSSDGGAADQEKEMDGR